MGAVRRVTCTEDGETYALKTLTHPSLEASALEAEAQALEAVRDEHVVRYVDYGSEPEAFLVMEYADSGTLEARLHELRLAGDEVEVLQALGWVDQTLSGLEAIHGAGLIHRDLKPANLLFSGETLLKVADFGIARIADVSTVSGTFRGWGTDFYRPPEGWLGPDGPRPTPAYDLYTLGVIAYEVLAGQLPFLGDRDQLRHAHMFEAPPSLSAARPKAPTQLTTIILRLLAKDPSARPQSASEVRELLATISASARDSGGAGNAAAPEQANDFTDDIRRRSAEMAARVSNEEAAALEAAENARRQKEIVDAGVKRFEELFAEAVEEFKKAAAPHGVSSRRQAEGWIVEVEHSPRQVLAIVAPISFEAPNAPGRIVLFGAVHGFQYGERQQHEEGSSQSARGRGYHGRSGMRQQLKRRKRQHGYGDR